MRRYSIRIESLVAHRDMKYRSRSNHPAMAIGFAFCGGTVQICIPKPRTASVSVLASHAASECGCGGEN